MADTSLPRRRATSSGNGWQNFDPFRLIWRGLTSVRFALGLIGLLAIFAALGLAIPQLPTEMRENPMFRTAWFEEQHDRFGVLAPPMERLGLFEVFRSVWFVSGLALLVASVCVCTANRLPPIWRNVFHPQTRVSDDYLTRGDASVKFEAPDAEPIAEGLRKRRYNVRTTQDNGATYIFADRYPWAQFATFISHLALILFLAGGLVTLISAREEQVLVAEGETPFPVFALNDPDHMQIYVERAVGEFDATGFPLDYRTFFTVYRDGEEVASGVSTVNEPLNYNGYNFHQTGFFPDGAALQVRDAETGRLVYDEVLALINTAATPRVVVRDANGAVILDDALVPTDTIGNTWGTSVRLGEERRFWIGARPSQDETGWRLVIFEFTGGEVPAGGSETERVSAILTEGEQLDLGGMTLNFAGMIGLPSSNVSGVPGLDGDGVAELSRGREGEVLTVGPFGGRALALAPGEPTVLDGYEYTFLGQRNFSGITVRRDPGAVVIWVATGVFMLGLALTFYTPRRRLWGKISAGQAAFRGLGGRHLAIEKEIREVAAQARHVDERAS